MSDDRERDAVPSPMEEAGLPDLEAGAPEQRWARDPEIEAVPGDRPVGVEEYGTTFSEMHDGESLALKLEREVPDVSPDTPERPTDEGRVGRLVAEGDDGVVDAEKDEVARDVGVDLGGATAEEAAMHVEPG